MRYKVGAQSFASLQISLTYLIGNRYSITILFFKLAMHTKSRRKLKCIDLSAKCKYYLYILSKNISDLCFIFELVKYKNSSSIYSIKITQRFIVVFGYKLGYKTSKLNPLTSQPFQHGHKRLVFETSA